MGYRTRALFLLAAGLWLAAAAPAGAGGFARGTADTDILFEDGQFLMRGGATVVLPQRSYATITAPAALGGGKVNGADDRFTETYEIPSFALKFDVTSDLRCAGTQTTPFGAALEFGAQAIRLGAYADGTGTVREGFDTNEFAATCAYKFDMGRGRAWLIGGVYVEDFNYLQTVEFAPFLPQLLAGRRATLTFDGNYQPGYRIGAAYEIPEIALRGELLYRSGIDVEAPGKFTSPFDPYTGGPVATKGHGSLPQSVELRMQSGVAPGWLAFGSVKWTDWSVLDTFDYNILGLPAFSGNKSLEFFWRDGWTATAGIGHSFSKSVTGLISFTYDRGVSTTEDAQNDSYTLASGVSLKDKFGGELRLGGAVSYLTGGSVSATPSGGPPGIGPGNSFAYTVDGDFAYALSGSYKVKW